MCSHFQQSSRGGRRTVREVVGRGRPSGQTPKSVLCHIRSLAPAVVPSEDPSPNFFPSSVLNKLCCCICTEVTVNPVSLSCGETICSECCCKSILITNSLECPCCFRHTLTSETISPPSSLFMSLLNDSVLFCIRGCGKMVKLQEYKQHLDSRCKSFIVNADSPSKVTLKDVMRKSTSTPATPAETKAAQNLIRRLINQGNSDSNTPGVLKVSTSGQVHENNNETSAYMYYLPTYAINTANHPCPSPWLSYF